VATQRHHARAFGFVVVAVVLAGCGGGSASRVDWRANAHQVVSQLRADVLAAEAGGPTRAAAARQLADTSQLVGLLLAYNELADCHRMVVATLAPAKVVRVLAASCGHLQRAAVLFTRANTHNDPDALVRASREAALAEPQLVRASLALKR
jgi:hypothetical protein